MGAALSRQEISAAVTDLGWRYILGTARTCVRTRSLAEAAAVAGRLIAAAGEGASESLRADIRADQVVLTAQSLSAARVTSREVDLIRRVSAASGELGYRTDPDVGGSTAADPGTGAEATPRSAQILEIAIDAMDINAVRPFWRAVLGYVDQPGETPPNGLIDPLGLSPAFWFQQMDEPRPQRNRFHIDVSVPHDEAQRRIAATLTAGGQLLSDAEAPSFWVLADAEGNEACVTTWQGRDS